MSRCIEIIFCLSLNGIKNFASFFGSQGVRHLLRYWMIFKTLCYKALLIDYVTLISNDLAFYQQTQRQALFHAFDILFAFDESDAYFAFTSLVFICTICRLLSISFVSQIYKLNKKTIVYTNVFLTFPTLVSQLLTLTSCLFMSFSICFCWSRTCCYWIIGNHKFVLLEVKLIPSTRYAV